MKKNKKKEDKETNYSKTILLNLAAGLVTWVLIWMCYKESPAYTWVYDSLLKGNYTSIQKNRKITLNERRVAKLGFDFQYLQYLKETTPENAVILMPSPELYSTDKNPFEGQIVNKLFRLRVLYPRKIVDANETKNRYREEITHVAIVNGWGYDKLNYEPNPKISYGILPVNPSNNN